MSEGILVDSTLWSLTLRRPHPHISAGPGLELQRLIAARRALLIGPIRQEVLCGLTREGQFERVDRLLAPLPNEPVLDEDYRDAARCFNLCRSRGIQGSHTDFLLCAVARRLDCSIFTTDLDFARYQSLLAFRLHAAGGGA